MLVVTAGTSTSAPSTSCGYDDQHLAVEILAVALEARIVRDVEDDEHVATRRRRAAPALPTPRIVMYCPVATPGGICDLDRLLAAHASVALALLARRRR